MFTLENFSCGYPSFRLSEISFSVAKGDFIGIIGPNGSGKTTLFRGITGVIPSTGEIELDGSDLRMLSLRQRAQRIAVVPQTVEADSVSVEDFVLMGRLPYLPRFRFFETRNDIEIAEEQMRLCDIFHYKSKLMTELSGGEQQRAAIARALTQQPDLLLLDEATAHLDITHQARLMKLIRRLNETTSLTVLMIIHDLNLAAEYCNRLLLMHNGHLCAQGNPAEVLSEERIERVYQTPVFVHSNPLSGKPVVMLR
ncbi:MAG: ABC transporter ATP-binding protein [Prevotellaceae bacterium]|nr:ABC transporter ATP-binding protein [Prevotellaceae bacterium]